MRVSNAASLPARPLPGRQMVELFSGRQGGAERVTLRAVEVRRLEPPEQRHPHEHRGVEECIYVLAGRGRAWVSGETAPIGPGDAVLVPPDTPHLLINDGAEPLRVLCFFPTADLPASLIEHPEIVLPPEELYGHR